MREVYAVMIESGSPFLVMDYPTAEMVKVAANSFLATKISFHQRDGGDLRGDGGGRDTTC